MIWALLFIGLVLLGHTRTDHRPTAFVILYFWSIGLPITFVFAVIEAVRS